MLSEDSVRHASTHRLVSANAAQLDDYLCQAERFLKIRFPTEYVSRSQVYTLLDQVGRVVGGFMVVSREPFRSLQSLPVDQLGVWNRTGRVTGSVAEVNGVWVESVHKTLYVSFTFWCEMIGKLLETSHQQFLFTFDNSNRQMRGHVSFLNADVLYSGKTLQLDGMQATAEETILTVGRCELETVRDMLLRRGVGSPQADEVDLVGRIRTRQKNATRLYSVADPAEH